MKLLLLFISLYLSLTNAHADIYFNAKIAGPITDVSAINEEGEYYKISSGQSQQDKDFAIATQDLIAFASNRAQSPNERVQHTMNIFLREINIEEKPEEVLTQLSQSNHFSFAPQFSPDKKTLTYISQSQDKINHLYAYDLKTKTQKILFSAPQIIDYQWSKDSQKVLYSMADAHTSSIKIFALHSQTHTTLLRQITTSPLIAQKSLKKDLPQATNNKPAYLIGAKWSPDETKVAFINHPVSASESKSAKVYDISTRTVSTLSQASQQVQAPLTWRSDSQALLYSALIDYKVYYDETLRDKVYEGAMHIFTTNIAGKTTQLTDGNHYHGRPIFSPDNKNIAYLFAEKLGGQLTYRLRTMDKDGKNTKQIYSSVYRESFLNWK